MALKKRTTPRTLEVKTTEPANAVPDTAVAVAVKGAQAYYAGTVGPKVKLAPALFQAKLFHITQMGLIVNAERAMKKAGHAFERLTVGIVK